MRCRQRLAISNNVESKQTRSVGGKALQSEHPSEFGLMEWSLTDPTLQAAYEVAKKRFKKIPNVAGIGIGRRFLESQGKYAVCKNDGSQLGIKVFVLRKLTSLSKKDTLPCWIKVKPPGRTRTVRIPVDVVAVKGKKKKGRAARQQSGRGWPTAGRVDVGHLFAFSKNAVANPPPAAFSPSDVSLGTVGALIRNPGNTVLHAVSSAHVFIQPCAGRFNSPIDNRAVGVGQSKWTLLPSGSFRPLTVAVNNHVRDALAFEVPLVFRGTPRHWPDGFTGEFATPEDVQRAIAATTSTGFVWVERPNRDRPRMIPVDLQAIVEPLLLPVDCEGSIVNVSYIQAWPFRFISPSDTTEEGDSGAGVFLWAENNSDCRLLGFHFMELGDHSYAVDARSFLTAALGGTLGQDYFFAT